MEWGGGGRVSRHKYEEFPTSTPSLSTEAVWNSEGKCVGWEEWSVREWHFVQKVLMGLH